MPRCVLISFQHLVPFYERLKFVNKGPSKAQFGGGNWIDMVRVAPDALLWSILTHKFRSMSCTQSIPVQDMVEYVRAVDDLRKSWNMGRMNRTDALLQDGVFGFDIMDFRKVGFLLRNQLVCC